MIYKLTFFLTVDAENSDNAIDIVNSMVSTLETRYVTAVSYDLEESSQTTVQDLIDELTPQVDPRAMEEAKEFLNQTKNETTTTN